MSANTSAREAIANPISIVPKVEVYSPRTVAELIAWGKEHPIEWYVPDIILEEGVHILHGLEESYKTMLMLQLHEVLTRGGEFLLRKVRGGLRTGIAELEMKARPFARRLENFFKNPPKIAVLPEELRLKVLSGKLPVERVAVLVDWARSARLQFVSIDSMSKLFPPGHDTNRQDNASEVFNQLQLLPTTLILAHDRKPSHDPKANSDSGNAEIVGSGRMSQDPDAVFQMTRSDKRMPMAEFSWGKNREGDKSDPLPLYFDKVNFRLYPIHPFIHLLPATRAKLLAEAERRYGWKQRHVDEHIAKLKDLRLADGSLAVQEELVGHTKRLVLLGTPTLQQIPG